MKCVYIIKKYLKNDLYVLSMAVWMMCDKIYIELYKNDIKKISKKLTRKKVQERFGVRKLLFIIFNIIY